MITMSAKIELGSVTNISNVKIQSVGTDFNGKFTRFEGTQLSDNSGVFSVPYKITIDSESPITLLKMAFDTQNNYHPKKIVLKEGQKVSEYKSERKSEDYYGNLSYIFVIPAEQQVEPPFEIFQNSLPEIDGIQAKISLITYLVLLSSYEVEVIYEGASPASAPDIISMRVRFYDAPMGKTLEYVDDDAIYTLKIENNEALTIIVEIYDWNNAYSPLVISEISTGITLNIDRRNMITMSRNIFDRSDIKSASYGIISNTGTIEFNDLDGEVLDYAEMLLLTSDLKVKINLNNTLTKTTEQIGEYETRTWNYDNNNRRVSVSLKDDLEEWQDISVDGFSYDPRNPYLVLQNGTMAELYEWLYEFTPSKYKMLHLVDLDEQTRKILQNTRIRYPFLESSSLWRQWQKLCEVCGVYIYKNNKSETVCIYTLGS